jgi:hypothetical protein
MTYVRTTEPEDPYLAPREAWAGAVLDAKGKILLSAVDAAVDAARAPLLHRIAQLERDNRKLREGRA